MRLKIPLLGQGYKHRSLPLSAQTCKMLIPELNRETQHILSLQPFPGITVRYSGSSSADGGLHRFQSELYKITGNTLYKYSSVWAQTSIGTIAGSGKASIISDASKMIIVRGGNVYSYDGTTLASESDADFETPSFVAYLNNQAIYDGDDARFCVSDAGDLANIDGLNYATAEVLGDDLIAPYAYNEMLYLFGESSIEPWYNSGAGNPPFDRIKNSVIPVGTKWGHSISSNHRYIYFLGSDRAVYRILGTQTEKISTIPLAQQFATYSAINSAIGICFSFDNQDFYYLSIPGKEAWCYCEDSNSWFELTTGTDETPYKATSYCECYDKKLFAIDGSIYSLESDSYQNGSDTIIRERTSALVNAALLGVQYQGLKMIMGRLDLFVRAMGIATGQGSAPIVMLSFSDDYGNTWSSERQLIGANSGQHYWKMTTDNLGQFEDRVFKIRISDPIMCSLEGAVAEVEVCIG